jgi:hypothetical protein
MKRSDRLLTKKLTINRETIRALARVELTEVAGALLDSTAPCTWANPLGSPTNGTPCG